MLMMMVNWRLNMIKRKLITADVHLKNTSFSIPYDKIMNCYEKGSFYCIVVLNGKKREVYKHPINDIFRVREDYD